MNLQKLIPLVLQVSVLLTVFAIGLRASLRDATYMFHKPGKLIRALISMNVLMPLFAVFLISVFDLTPAVRIALVALSLSPIPPLLPNKLVKKGATDSYAIGMLVALALLALVIVPIALEIIELVLKVPLNIQPSSIAKVVFITALLPLGIGMAVHSVLPHLAERAAKPVSQIAGIALLVSFFAILIAAAPPIWTLVGNGTVIALAAFVLVGLAIGHLLGGPGSENRTALAISTASRHPGIALALAAANFPQEKLVMAAVILYLFVNAVASVPYLWWTQRRKETDGKQVKACAK